VLTLKIRIKVLLTALISLLVALICTFFIVEALLVGYIEKEEISIVKHNYDKAVSILRREEGSLRSTVLDWAQWDDSYQFIKDSNSQFIKENLYPEALEAINLQYMIFLDKEYNVVFANSAASLKDQDSTVLESLLKQIKVKDAFKNNPDMDQITGETAINGVPMLVSVAQVTDGTGKKPGNGYLLIVRYLDNEFVKYVENVLQVGIVMLPSKTEGNTAGLQIEQSGADSGIGVMQIEKNESILKSYVNMKDILKDKPISLLVQMDREIYRNGITAVIYFGLICGFALLSVAGFCIYVFDMLVTHRISRLHAFVDNVAISKDTSVRIDMNGTDEISKLAANMNNMLEKIDSSYKELKERDERFRLIMDATNDGFFDVNVKSGELYISPSMIKYLGYAESYKTTSYKEFLNNILSEDRGKFEVTFNQYLAKESEIFRVECRIFKQNKDWIWVVFRGKLIDPNEQGVPVRLVGTISDITKRKIYEEANLYLMQTDSVTELKNRTYMEKMLLNADQCKECDGWLIMGDVNGLKLINDSFGHQEGDRLLRTIGDILKKCCSASDTPARWGGDEFLILVLNRDAAYVDMLIQTIKSECEHVINYPFKISIALGSARKDKNHVDSDTVLKLAEERMYRNKLLESRSTRSAILSSLEQSLHETHMETEEHTRRIKNMCLMIGNYLGLSREELDELALLGVLHDIGKIAIPEAVLAKPGKLTNEEWEIMKTHTEIGYRIAASTPELAHIADKILSHHERYDGSGYPHGLAGSSIPKLSRLLAIVDSFDVMTHDRIYKKAMSVESAVNELKACSGTQFDPEMVETFLKLLAEERFDSNTNESIA
jgi:diguanylate cyclase (GGDEF)-like protein/PAS domain S-box-containing protein